MLAYGIAAQILPDGLPVLTSMLSSMTGFGQSHGSFEGATWSWELKSVNGRSLDLRMRTPHGFDDLEAPLRDILSKNFSRGTINVTLNIERPERDFDVRINQKLVNKIAEVAKTAHLQAPGLDGLLSLKGVVEIVEAKDTDGFHIQLREKLIESFLIAVESLRQARLSEGAIIFALFISQVETIEDVVEKAGAHKSRTTDAIAARLREQIQPLLDAIPLDEARLYQEAALIATRVDIQEEIERLRAHCQQLRALVGEGAALGRRLDFLAQEFNREANTLCSKAHDKDLTALGLSLKNVIDQFREQAQNVE